MPYFGWECVGLGCLRLDSLLWLSCQGVTSILPVLREGVLTGSPEQKEEAAKGLGLVIRLTSADALRPSVVSITGPLIRILGDRFNWTVKAALLETLSLLLGKASELGNLGFHLDPGEQICLQETNMQSAMEAKGLDHRHGAGSLPSPAVAL